MTKQDKNSIHTRLENYFSIVALVPALLAIVAYEILAFMVHQFVPGTYYEPVNGLGIMIPMALLMELFTFFLTKNLRKKVTRLTNAINEVAAGNFDITLDASKAAPFVDVYQNFNKMTMELRSVESLRNDFINNFSHEFKTPIASIGGFAELLQDPALLKEDRSEYLQIISDESKRLAHLAEQTMMISKLDNQTDIPDKVNFSLDEQLRRSIILLQAAWGEKQIVIEPDLEKIWFHGNPSLMSHVWINLLNNAIKFTPREGTITVRAFQKDNEITVSILDTGIGMTEEQVRHIFQKYYQADTSHATKGMGLGLSIAHRIVELCGGTIAVTSSIGNGSSFTVNLPAENQSLQEKNNGNHSDR